MNTKELMEIQTALRNGSELSDSQVAKVAELQRVNNSQKRWVSVAKLALRQGEVLWDFISALVTAVHTDRVILADGSLDAWLHGIYEDHVIVQDMNSGRFFKAMFTRLEDGSFRFEEPVEVMMTFTPVEMGDEDVERAVSKRAPIVQHLEVSTVKRKWDGILPRRF